MLVINESGLYALIFKSRKPEAKRFKRWVTHEVLPAIRKTGAYVAPGASGELFPGGAPLPAPAINVNLLADAVDRGLMSKRTASGMIKAWLLAQNPAMAAVLASQQVRPATAQAPVQLQLETKPQPKLKPALKPFKLSPRRCRNEVDGVNFVLSEVASHCGVSFDDLLRSMRDHGLIDQAGQTMARGREFVAFTKRGSRHWKVGALIRHLSA